MVSRSCSHCAGYNSFLHTRIFGPVYSSSNIGCMFQDLIKNKRNEQCQETTQHKNITEFVTLLVADKSRGHIWEFLSLLRFENMIQRAQTTHVRTFFSSEVTHMILKSVRHQETSHLSLTDFEVMISSTQVNIRDTGQHGRPVLCSQSTAKQTNHLLSNELQCCPLADWAARGQCLRHGNVMQIACDGHKYQTGFGGCDLTDSSGSLALNRHTRSALTYYWLLEILLFGT